MAGDKGTLFERSFLVSVCGCSFGFAGGILGLKNFRMQFSLIN
jgi:hypothetical protein